MNESGGAVSTLAKYYDVEPDHVVVVHDEIDIGLGQLRVKFGGGDNGHNGLKSLRKSLDTGDFYRVRVGVGRPNGSGEVHDYVLKGFNAAERKELPLLVSEAADAVTSLTSKGLEWKQAVFHRCLLGSRNKRPSGSCRLRLLSSLHGWRRRSRLKVRFRRRPARGYLRQPWSPS